MAKVFCSEAIWRVVDRCVQVLGGQGVTGETLVERIFREVRAFRIYDGPSEVHRWSLAQRIARQGPELVSEFDLSGKVCIVTGAGRGIGRGMAEGLARHGGSLCWPGRTEATLDEAAAAIGDRAACRSPMCRARPMCWRCAMRCWRAHGRIDVLVNNAGINPIFRGIERISLEDWQSIIDINLTGMFLCCKHIGGVMAAGRVPSSTSVRWRGMWDCCGRCRIAHPRAGWRC